ncbi:ParB family chromosome partitioning protein [Cellulosimicrobium cellulans]|jgi:ParB family chromosome partitioning protein|uniref:ParB/RepB/Spo0J family partition protein n=1 Tax=Cellulosimicrobium cellulans TaxID=1710 RepID=UPI0019586E42|nr:ParB/RepB/Spo0J family partition protein [Cellulosimicrobium cellulans]MBM7817805.1 ParB family chromosome partitioning protein [Cellulosimicrobium cellulans]
MSEKRRGLGRGLGALIPTSSEGKRPVDVFFPSPTEEPVHDDVSSEDALAAPGEDRDAAEKGTGPVPVVTLVADAGSGPADLDSLTSLSAHDLAELDALSAGGRGPLGASDAEDERSGTQVTSPGGGDTAPPPADSPDDVVSRETAPQAQNGDGSAVSGAKSTSESPADGDGAVTEEWAGSAAADLVPVPGARFAEVPTASIRPNPRQPRTVFDEGDLDELIGSIREIGVLQPIVVRPVPGEDGSFELIMGERRWRATQAAGLDVIPAIIRETDDADLLRDALLENLHRSALNPLEEAAAYRQLLDDFGCTHEELAERISRSRPQISNTLRLLRLPPLVQRRVAAGVLSAGHARALLGLTDGADIERLAQRIVAEGLSVRATEEIVAMGGLDGERRAPRAPRAGQRSAAIDELAHRLSDRFETRVKVDLGKNKGRLTVEFASVEDLNRILDVMAPEDPGLLRK